jgi:hypothetical protein
MCPIGVQTMSAYCNLIDIQNILPDNIIIGTNLLADNVSILESDVNLWITYSSDIIDSELRGIYRTPLIMTKTLDYTSSNPTIVEDWPVPIRIICARITVGHIYEELVASDQEPNVSEYGGNVRSLGYDQLAKIQSGIYTLQGQIYNGHRFVRKTLLDDPRVSRPGEMAVPQRVPGK